MSHAVQEHEHHSTTHHHAHDAHHSGHHSGHHSSTTYGNPVYTSTMRDSHPTTHTYHHHGDHSTAYTSGVLRHSHYDDKDNHVTMDVVRTSGHGHHDHLNAHGYHTHGERVSHTTHTHSHVHSGRHSTTHYGEGKVVQVNKGEPIVKETREGRNSVVLGSRVVGSKVVAEHYNTRIIGETLNHLAERVIDNRPAPRKSVRHQVQTYEEEPVFVEKIVEKEVEVVVERKVPKQVFIDVPYEVVVEQPIERVIEKEIEVEQVVEKIIEKDVEVPIEKIVEIPIEEVVEQPVEIIKYIDVPVTKVVTKEVEDHIENIVYDDRHIDCDVHDLHKYHNAHILPTKVDTHHRDVFVPRPVFHRNNRHNVVEEHVEKVIKVPKEKIVEQIVENLVTRPTFHSVHKEHLVTVPVEKVIEKPVEHIVEKPVIRKNIIRRPVPIEKHVEEIVHIHQDREVVQHVDVEVHQPRYHNHVIQKPIEVEHLVHVDKKEYHDVMVPVDEVHAHHTHLVSERPQTSEVVEHTEIEYLVHKQRPVPEEDIIEIAVPRFQKHMNHTEVEVPVKVLKIIEEPVAEETEVIVQVENKIERPVYEEVIEKRPVIVKREVIEYYDVIKEKIVEVEREEDVEVCVKTRIQHPVENYQTLEERVAVDKNVIEPVPGREINEGNVEVTDDDLAHRIEHNRAQLKGLMEENHKLKHEFKHFEHSVRGLNTREYNSLMRQLAEMRASRSELQSRISIMIKDTDRLMQTSERRCEKTQMTYTTIAPEVHNLRRKLEGLIHENRQLCSQAKAICR